MKLWKINLVEYDLSGGGKVLSTWFTDAWSKPKIDTGLAFVRFEIEEVKKSTVEQIYESALSVRKETENDPEPMIRALEDLVARLEND